MKNLIFLFLSYIILTTYAFSNSVSEYISNLIPGEGDTEVSIDLRENHSPDYSILLVREIDRSENGNYFTRLTLSDIAPNQTKTEQIIFDSTDIILSESFFTEIEINIDTIDFLIYEISKKSSKTPTKKKNRR